MNSGRYLQPLQAACRWCSGCSGQPPLCVPIGSQHRIVRYLAVRARQSVTHINSIPQPAFHEGHTSKPAIQPSAQSVMQSSAQSAIQPLAKPALQPPAQPAIHTARWSVSHTAFCTVSHSDLCSTSHTAFCSSISCVSQTRQSACQHVGQQPSQRLTSYDYVIKEHILGTKGAGAALVMLWQARGARQAKCVHQLFGRVLPSCTLHTLTSLRGCSLHVPPTR
jgi:hypothetical protein